MVKNNNLKEKMQHEMDMVTSYPVETQIDNKPDFSQVKKIKLSSMYGKFGNRK